MHQASLDMLQIHTLFLDVQEHHLCFQVYDQESSCALDNLKHRKKITYILLQNENSQDMAGDGKQFTECSYKYKLVFCFIF